MQRVCEPEVMDTPDEAHAYDSMDHGEVNSRFVADLLAFTGELTPGTRILDLGCGTALIPIELCSIASECHVVAIDAAQSMLDVAARNIAGAGLGNRIDLVLEDAKTIDGSLGKFPVVMSNSLVHHLPSPESFFRSAAAHVAQGGYLFARDLFRPDSEQQLNQLVATYTEGCDAQQRGLFADSLRAALTLDEVRSLVSAWGYSPESVTQTTDRHWTWAARA